MSLLRNEIYEDITNRLIEKLSQGTIPWRKSWEIGLPSNLISNKPTTE